MENRLAKKRFENALAAVFERVPNLLRLCALQQVPEVSRGSLAGLSLMAGLNRLNRENRSSSVMALYGVCSRPDSQVTLRAFKEAIPEEVRTITPPDACLVMTGIIKLWQDSSHCSPQQLNALTLAFAEYYELGKIAPQESVQTADILRLIYNLAVPS